MIKAENLVKRYKDKAAVSDLSFTVREGKVTGFLGPNGAGKSTTMRLMLGLDKGSGKTEFDGKPIYKHHNPAEIVGILLDAKAFHPTRTARNHLRALAAAGGISDSRVDEVLDIVGLKDVARKKPGKFSLGMSQRLGIAAAILGNHKYLMLDEPANGLDPEGIHWLRQFIKDYADQGNGVFVSSHLLSEMSQMADDLVVIGKGKLISSGTMKGFIEGNQSSSVIIRTSNQATLKKGLKNIKADFSVNADQIIVNALTTDEVGKLAFQNGVAVYELRPQEVSLEDAFLKITTDAQEYKSSAGAKK